MTHDLQELIKTTLKNPREAAKQARESDLPIIPLFQLAVLVCLVGSILTSLQISLYPVDNAPSFPLGNIAPFSVALYGFLSFAILTLGTFLGGRLFGGKGTLPATLLSLTLIQSIMVGIQIINLVAGLILPATIESWIGILGFAYFIFLFCIFVAELHDFRSPFMVFLGSLGFFLILILVFGSIVLWLVSNV
ncbi:MAG: YIP1 family protein [Rhodobacteraceae bacterium]|nr:YIP1 family protein [Paracoccaceae bacterium]